MRFRVSNVRSAVALSLAIGVVFLVIFGPFVSPYNPNLIANGPSLSAPSRIHRFGTDLLGRDMLSRVLTGGRNTISVALFAVLIGGVPGFAFGVAVGMGRRSRGGPLIRVMDLWMAIPGILLAVVFGAVFGRSSLVLAFSLGIAGVPSYFRQARAETLKYRNSEFVTAARSMGAGSLGIWFRHILPNVIPPLVVFVTLRAGGLLLAIAGLSFVGLGAQPPDPEWGSLLADARDHMYQAWWLMVFPGAAIGATVFSLNLIGDVLRDYLDRGAG